MDLSGEIMSADSITVKFGFIAKKLVIDGLSLTLGRSECVAIVGKNGAGKTTLLKTIAGLLVPNAGKIKHNARVSYLPETLGVYSNLTGLETLRFFSRTTDKPQKLDAVLQKVGMYQDRNKVLATCSKGMKRRILFGAMLTLNSDLYIMDEPFDGLDPGISSDLAKTLIDLKNDGHAFVVSSHDLNYIEKISDRILLLQDGKIIREIKNGEDVRYVIRFTSKESEVRKTLNRLNIKVGLIHFPSVEIISVGPFDELLSILSKEGLRFDEARPKNLYEIFQEVLE